MTHPLNPARDTPELPVAAPGGFQYRELGPQEAATLNVWHDKTGLQVFERSTLHQISKPEGFTSPKKAPPTTTTMGQSSA
jgi:hypothetical protein